MAKLTIQNLEKQVYVGRYFTPEDEQGQRLVIHPETNESAVLMMDGTLLKDKLIALAQSITDARGYTDEKIAAVINGAPEAYDTLLEISQKLNSDDEVTAGILETIGKKANADAVYTKEEVDALLEAINNTVTALDFYTKAETDAKVKAVDDKFANYYNKTEMDQTVADVRAEVAAVPVVVTGEAAIGEVEGLKATDIYCQFI